MATKTDSQSYVRSLRPALRGLFECRSKVDEAQEAAKQEQDVRHREFMQKEFDPGANLHYAMFANAAERARDDSRNAVAGAILGVAKQAVSFRFGKQLPSLVEPPQKAGHSTVELIWHGRNNALHWEEAGGGGKKAFLDALGLDRRKNNAAAFLNLLEWTSANDPIEDLLGIIACELS